MFFFFCNWETLDVKERKLAHTGQPYVQLRLQFYWAGEAFVTLKIEKGARLSQLGAVYVLAGVPQWSTHSETL